MYSHLPVHHNRRKISHKFYACFPVVLFQSNINHSSDQIHVIKLPAILIKMSGCWRLPVSFFSFAQLTQLFVFFFLKLSHIGWRITGISKVLSFFEDKNCEVRKTILQNPLLIFSRWSFNQNFSRKNLATCQTSRKNIQNKHLVSNDRSNTKAKVFYFTGLSRIALHLLDPGVTRTHFTLSLVPQPVSQLCNASCPFVSQAL